MSDVRDQELWNKSLQGDADAFGEIFERHARSVYNYLFRRCGDWATAEDLTSIVFLEAWRKRGKVNLSHGSALPFLLGMATNVLRNRRRSERRYQSALRRMPLAAESLENEPDLLERLAAEDQMRRVLKVFSQLPRREQDVVSLCLYVGLSYEEAAAALDLPVGTVRSRLSRGRQRLRELLSAEGHNTLADENEREGQEVIS